MGQIIDMQLLNEREELIDRYLKNQMDAEEERKFEAMLRTDSALRKHARFVAQTVQAMKCAHGQSALTADERAFRMVAKNPLAKPKK